MEKDNCHSHQKIGVFDESGELVSLLIDVFGPKNIMIFTPTMNTPVMSENIKSGCDNKSLESYLTNKEDFFDTSEHIVLKLISISDISMFTHAILCLFQSKIKTLTVVTLLDLKPILRMGEVGEQKKLKYYQNKDIVSIKSNFSLIEFKLRI